MIIRFFSKKTSVNYSMEEFPVSKSYCFKVLLLEREEIQRLKWLESEKAGRDIGIDHAFFIWNTKHKALWWNYITGSIK